MMARRGAIAELRRVFVPWLVIVLGMTDVMLTVWGLLHGGQELNPIAASVLALGGVLALVLLIAFKALALGLYSASRKRLLRPDAAHPRAGPLAALVVDALALAASGGAVIVGLGQVKG